jgi:phytoene synthase
MVSSISYHELTALAGWPAAWRQAHAPGLRTCEAITRARAGNFYAAFRTLPGPRRRALCALYAFCRLADDIADGERSLAERSAGLAALATALETHQPQGPVLAALAEVAHDYGIERADLAAIVAGCQMDLVVVRMPDLAALEHYCFHVASAVGLAALAIFGYRGERRQVRRHAVALGLAMQLTNIVRDVAEDARAGRVYLPADWLAAAGIDADAVVVQRPDPAALAAVLERLVVRAREHYCEGVRLVPWVRRSSQACPATLAATYGALLDQIERRGVGSVWQRRPRLSTPHKLAIAFGCWVAHAL